MGEKKLIRNAINALKEEISENLRESEVDLHDFDIQNEQIDEYVKRKIPDIYMKRSVLNLVVKLYSYSDEPIEHRSNKLKSYFKSYKLRQNEIIVENLSKLKLEMFKNELISEGNYDDIGNTYQIKDLRFEFNKEEVQ